MEGGNVLEPTSPWRELPQPTPSLPASEGDDANDAWDVCFSSKSNGYKSIGSCA